ncbi:transforming growth factor beta activator LRRC33 [Hemiscyllium ocellatum]|uniref:transforming growth factor beta activator LRRC33 n=1 Tax=Hemiscyllium ocellatum TaxID=170820 RepID=UPI0029675A80|nr:transforming growth factor beta activator LRRC33 [Hemiscyllium ocellatum]XP_060690325.1 transforming growth factor beta activator LRRC33 [Hemiscyllium ocellatum]XP_060690326.1 transforming growth factor beta activator LRRC33 [Hemiscyllium ocellatum]
MELRFCSMSLTLTALMMLAGASLVRCLGNCTMVDMVAFCVTRRLNCVPVDLPLTTEALFLNGNEIKAIQNQSLSTYRWLHTLDLSGNQLELIEPAAFSYNKNLQDLNLMNNRIDINYTRTRLALRSLSALTRLDLSGNRLSEVIVSYIVQNLTTLEYLSLARNFIMRLEPSTLEGLAQLQELNLENNYIYEIESGTFEGLKRLTRLNLAHNHISCIVDFNLYQVQTLNISHNVMELFLARETETEFQLETLDLSNNKLLFFPLLPKHNKLKLLLLADNEMNFYNDLMNDSASEVQFVQIVGNVTNVTSVNLWDEVISVNLPELQLLDMSRNSFRYLPPGFLRGITSLSALLLDQNCLRTFSLTEQDSLRFLQAIDLSHNQLSHLNFNISRLENLNYFNLSFNHLESVPSDLFTKMPRITTIDLSHNRVSVCDHPLGNRRRSLSRGCVALAQIKSLRQLYLSNCDLVTLPPNAFVASPLTHLDLSSNIGIRLEASMFHAVAKSLQSLSLRNNGLDSGQIGSGLQVTLGNLKTLDLSENSMTSLHPVLKNLRLRSLDLRKNRLSVLQPDVLYGLLQSLRTLYLSGNAFDCCRLQWWSFLANAESLTIRDRSAITCNTSFKLEPIDRISQSTKANCKFDNTVLKYFLLLLPTILCILSVCVMVLFSLSSKLLPKYVKAKCRSGAQY